MSIRTATGGHARPRKSLLPRWNRRAAVPQVPAAPFGGAPGAGLLPAPAADDTLLFRLPGLDGGPGSVVPPGPPWDQPADRPSRGPDLAELTLTDKPLGVLRPETAPERAEPGPDLAAAPQDRPYVPQDSGLPSAWLRAVPQSGPGGQVLETLTGMPFFAGIRHDPDGGRIGGLCWGAADDIWLVQDFKSVEVADAGIAALQELREHLAYGAFRAPAVQPDPDAAGHREVLERELDAIDAGEADGAVRGPGLPGDSIETARSVLRAAGNLGFLTAALRQRDGEGALNVFVARAALANAIESGDGAAAVRAAEGLVGIVSDLCGDEDACAPANGLAPADEAEAAAPAVPAEAVTAAGEGEAA